METPNHTFRRSPSGSGLFYGWFGAMHSRLDVIIAGREEKECRALLDAMFSRTAHLEKRLNRFDPDSDLWQINNLGEGVIPVDDEMIDILAGAAHYKTLTLGAFDIAVHSKNYDPKAEYLNIDFENFLLNVTAEGVTLDMGGYAKGLALEEMVGILREGGVESALVSFGNSSVYGLGLHPLGQPWSVGVEQAARLSGGGIALELADCAMSSSGNNTYNRGHIISPYDLQPVTDSRIISVSGPSPLDCEVLSTALFVTASRHGQETMINEKVNQDNETKPVTDGAPGLGNIRNGMDNHRPGNPEIADTGSGSNTLADSVVTASCIPGKNGLYYAHCDTADPDADTSKRGIPENLVRSILSNFDVRRAVDISIEGHRAIPSELLPVK